VPDHSSRHPAAHPRRLRAVALAGGLGLAVPLLAAVPGTAAAASGAAPAAGAAGAAASAGVARSVYLSEGGAVRIGVVLHAPGGTPLAKPLTVT